LAGTLVETAMPGIAAKPALAPEDRVVARRAAKTRLTLCLGLALLTVALYSGVRSNGFVNYDDDRYILTNNHVRAGLKWTTVVWAFRSVEEANWHPLTWLAHALDCQLFGVNPAGHHGMNLALHMANALLLFLLLERATGARWKSLTVAVLFAAHPLNVESVAWAAERKNVLAMLFFLLSLWAYGWYARRPSVKRYGVVALAFAMALMAKPVAITLPFVLLLADYWPLRRVKSSGDAAVNGDPGRCGEQGLAAVRLLWEKVPLLALAVGSGMVTMAAQKAGGAVNTAAAAAPLLRLENAVVCYVRYVEKVIWPARLAVLYPYPHALPGWQVCASLAFLVGVTGAVLYWRDRRYLLAGWFWYLATMAPMIGIVQVGNQAMADRYAYLPCVGLLVMAVWGAWEAAETLGSEKSGHVWRMALAGTMGCSVIALAAVTRMQVVYWHDDFTLWSHALAVTEGNYVAENNLGAILGKEGRVEEAVAHFRNAAALEPGDPGSQLNLGIYAQDHSDLRQAIARYETVVQLATDERIRGSAFAHLGQIYYAQGDYARAQKNYELAAQLHRAYPVEMGLIAEKMGEPKQAVVYFAQAVAAEPNDVGFLLLAQALKKTGDEADAQRAYERAASVSKDIRRAQQMADKLGAQ